MPLLEATPLLPLSDVGHRMTSPRHAADPDTPPCHLTSVAASPDQATPAKPPPPLPSRRCLHLGPSGTYDLCDRDREAAGRPRQAAVVGQDAGARDCECGATRRSRQATAGRDATPATLASVTAKPSADLAKPVPSRRTDAVAATSPHFSGEEKNLALELLWQSAGISGVFVGDDMLSEYHKWMIMSSWEPCHQVEDWRNAR